MKMMCFGIMRNCAKVTQYICDKPNILSPFMITINKVVHNNDDIISLCIPLIIKSVFKGTNNFFDFIINNATKQQLNKIYDIVKDTKFNNELLDNIDNKEKEENKVSSNFNLISTECITNTASYLTKDEIKNFKLTCFEFSIIALQELVKCQIFSLNTN